MKDLILICLVALAMSCNASRPAQKPSPSVAAPQVETRATTRNYTCMGNEPFWSVQIKGSEITFRTPDEGPVSYPYQAPQQRGNQQIFSSKAGSSNIQVTIKEEGCTDSMSGEQFPYTVEVSRDGKIFHGCGK